MMNAIKSKEQQNQTAAKFLPSTSTNNHRRRHTAIGPAFSLPESEISSWKQNAAQSQVEIDRDQLKGHW